MQNSVPEAVKNMNINVFNLMSRSNQRDLQNGMKVVNVNVDQMQVFVIITNFEIKMSIDVDVKN